MRNLPKELDAEAALGAWQQKCTEYQGNALLRYSCETITPLYGGGVEAGKVDVALPIRPSGLRGQLRFWWRLLNYNSDSRELFKAERAIWGGIGKEEPVASKVALQVEGVSAIHIYPSFTYKKESDGRYRSVPKPGPGINAYALFPAHGSLERGGHRIKEHPHQVAESGIRFALKLTLDPRLDSVQRQQVEEAVRWWASFGGIGARTRRGLGAVKVAGLLPVTEEEVTAKGGVLRLRQGGTNATVAWKEAVERLSNFRQQPGFARNPPKPPLNRPGRSRWPEPDAIRTLWGPRYTPRDHEPEHPVTDLYPRAAFGQPIVFHFCDPGEPTNPEPILEPDGELERMASPLILRPYWDGRRYCPAALLLPRWQSALKQKLKCKDKCAGGLSTWPSDPVEQATAAANIPPMAGRGDDPLSAFMTYFTEV